MANRESQSPAAGTEQQMSSGADYKPWTPPTTDQEFVFESVQAAPNWVDKSWASFDRGPALALPAGDLWGEGPYHTTTARVGDKVVFTAAKGAMPAKFTVIPGDPAASGGKKPPQQSAASLEDMLKSGVLSPDELGADGRSQVAARSPRLVPIIEGDTEIPEAVEISEVLKI